MDAGIAGAGYPDTAKSSAYGWASVRIGDNGELVFHMKPRGLAFTI